MRLGRVEVSGGFLLLLAWLNYTDTQGLIPQAVVSCALHEGGHWLAIQAVGGKVRRMRLGIAGAEMELGRPLSYTREALCALAGPEAAERTAGLLDGFLVGVLIAGGVILAWKGGSITLLFTAGWLFSSIWREKEGKRGCHIRRKQVK